MKKINKPIKVEKFARVSSIALRDVRLGQKGRLVYVALCDHMDLTGRCWPSVERIKALTGLGKTTIHEALDILESLGYIERIKRNATSNLYRVYEIPMNDLIEYASSLAERGTPRGEQGDRTLHEYYVFDEQTKVLRLTGTGSPPSDQKEEKREDEIKETWKKELQNPLGTEKKEQEMALRYIVRKENITLETVKDIIAMVKQSNFLQGQNERMWKPSLLWCIKNRERILSGRYTNFVNRAGETFVEI